MPNFRDPAELGYLIDKSDLLPGDILLFRAKNNSSYLQKLIMFLQSFILQPGGHYNTTHSVICTIVKNGQPYIAHITGSKVMGYKHEPLADMFTRDKEERFFFVFRPKNKEMAEALAKEAVEETNEQVRWHIPTAAAAFMHRAKLSPSDVEKPQKEISKNSFCSQFIIEIIKKAAQTIKGDNDQNKNYLPDIHSSSTPKMLEAYLYHHDNYDMLAYPTNSNPFDEIVNAIQTQLFRIQSRTDKKSKDKFTSLNKNFFTSLDDIALNHKNKNDMQKAIMLFIAVIPELQKSTGYIDTKNTKSLNKVMEVAKYFGMFSKDIDFSNKEKKEYIKTPVNRDKK